MTIRTELSICGTEKAQSGLQFRLKQPCHNAAKPTLENEKRSASSYKASVPPLIEPAASRFVAYWRVSTDKQGRSD